jgi:hypothetical protein
MRSQGVVGDPIQIVERRIILTENLPTPTTYCSDIPANEKTIEPKNFTASSRARLTGAIKR